MSEKRTYTGGSIGEALERAHKELPAGRFILDLKKQEAKSTSAEASALTVEEAFAQARKALPPEAAVLEEKVIRAREEGRMEFRAYQADEARAAAQRELGKKGQVLGVELLEDVKKGFFGIGAKPGLYAVAYATKAKVKLSYTTRAQVVAELGDASEAEARFLELAEKGDRELLEGLIRQGVSLGARDAKGASALMISAFYGKPETSLLLIEAGLDVNLKDQGGFTALMVACESAAGPIRLVERLVEKGADLNATSGRGSTALMAAAKSGHRELVELLVSKGAALDERNLDHNITALIWAANGGHRQIVEFLLSKGADKTIQTFNGYTAASIAAENGHQDIARLLS
jgi:ankyrin repeat protein